MTLLVTTLPAVGAQTLTAYRYALPFQDLGPVTDQTPVASSRRIRTARSSISSFTSCAVGAHTERVGRPCRKTGPRSALVARSAYRSSRTPAVCTPVAASRAPLAVRCAATTWPRRASRTRSRSRGSTDQAAYSFRCGNFAFWASVRALLVRRSHRWSAPVSRPSWAVMVPVREASNWVEAAPSEPFQATVFRSIQTALEVVRSTAAAEPAAAAAGSPPGRSAATPRGRRP